MKLWSRRVFFYVFENYLIILEVSSYCLGLPKAEMSFCDFEEVRWDRNDAADDLVQGLFHNVGISKYKGLPSFKKQKTEYKKKSEQMADRTEDMEVSKVSTLKRKRKNNDNSESDSVMKKQKNLTHSGSSLCDKSSESKSGNLIVKPKKKGRKKSKNKFKQTQTSDPSPNVLKVDVVPSNTASVSDRLDNLKLIKSDSSTRIEACNQMMKKTENIPACSESSKVRKVKKDSKLKKGKLKDKKTSSEKSSKEKLSKKVKKTGVKDDVESNSFKEFIKTSKSKSARGKKSAQDDSIMMIKSNNKKLPFKAHQLKKVFAKSEKLTAGSKQTESKVKVSKQSAVSLDQPSTVHPLSLRERLQDQLKAARFRYINQQLYTCQGSEAYRLFKEDQDAFQVYHQGFQAQVIKWPENPLDKMIKYISTRPQSFIVADFGCGDAKLAQSIPHKVHSFDLVALNPKVTACDMANIPLKPQTVDIGVFCLSLMGTNLVDYITEAHRVIKKRGTLLVAEVVSRFDKVRSFIRVMERLGFILLEKDTSNKMFVWFNFKKSGPIDKGLPISLELQPCFYKKR